MQSRRVWLPEIHRVQTLATLVADHEVAFAEPGGAPLEASHHFVVVGPEGGFSHEELQSAPATVSLGESVLRAETAAIVAGALMVNLRGGKR